MTDEGKRLRRKLLNDGLKACPRCGGCGWTYYESHKCQCCKGTGRAPRHLHRCEAMSAPVCGGKRYARRCQNVTSKRVDGQWVCHIHNPEGCYAGYRKFCRAHRSTAKQKLPDTEAAARWRKQHAIMVACARRDA